MKIPFRTDPDQALQSAQHGLAQAQETIARLQADRAVKLEEGAVDAVLAIDKQLEGLHRAVAINGDIILAMRKRLVDRERGEREKAKAKFIDELGKRLAKRQSAFEKLDQLLPQLVAAIHECKASDDQVFADWPSVVPSPRLFAYLKASLGEHFSSHRKNRMSAGILQELTAKADLLSFAADTAQLNGELLIELKEAAIPEMPAQEEIAA
jgi:hypothetical protein